MQCFIDILVYEEICCGSLSDVEVIWKERKYLQKSFHKELFEYLGPNSRSSKYIDILEEESSYFLEKFVENILKEFPSFLTVVKNI